nr:sulfatase-like hydrolase/transferase [Oceanococcus sp. HetDA_MAG_MS8]
MVEHLLKPLATVAFVAAAGCGGNTEPTNITQVDDSMSQLPLARNVVLLTADDYGPFMGAYGETRIATPQLDLLSSESLRFPVAHVTQSSCSSSRSSLMTGLFPSINGQIGLANHGFSVSPEYHTRLLPNLLHDAGLRTGIIGKLHVSPSEAFKFDFKQGLSQPQRVRDVAEAARRFWPHMVTSRSS